MQSIQRMIVVPAVLSALALWPAPLQAQSGITLWAGAGGSSQNGSVQFGKETKQIGVQVGLPIIPVAVRGDAMMFGGGVDLDAVSYNVNAVVQMRLPIAQPYAILGHGKYKVTPDTRVSGLNYGAGVRLGLGRFGVFGEVRRHHPVSRTVTVLGLTF
jgi:hypothetical protein